MLTNHKTEKILDLVKKKKLHKTKFKKYIIKESDKVVITYVFNLWILQIKIRRIKYV